MSPKVLKVEKEEKGDTVIYKRVVQDEIIGKIHQLIMVTKNEAVRRSWSAWGYAEKRLKRIKTKDGREGIDVIWGNEGEGRSDWYWCIIVPPDSFQIDRLFESIRDLERFDTIIVHLHNEILTKNVNRRVEHDLSFLLSLKE